MGISIKLTPVFDANKPTSMLACQLASGSGTYSLKSSLADESIVPTYVEWGFVTPPVLEGVSLATPNSETTELVIADDIQPGRVTVVCIWRIEDGIEITPDREHISINYLDVELID